MTTVTFTSSGSWQSPATTGDVQCWGEGGNGESGLPLHDGGSGGGGGEYAEETTLALTVNNTYNFTIGSGASGNNTIFPGDSVTVTAHRGTTATGINSPGTGGSGSTNSIHHNGGNGGLGTAGTSGFKLGSGGGGSGGSAGAGGNGVQGGVGGAGGSGSPGGAAGGNGGSGGGNGFAGSAPGGGGGGPSTPGSPGSGAGGQITIIYTASVTGTATLAGAGTLTALGVTFNPAAPPATPYIQPGEPWLRRYARWLHQTPPGKQIITVTGSASLSGAGTLTAVGNLPNPVVVNQWANSYGQGTTFTSITSALQSCVVGLNASFSVGPGTGTPTVGNWLFCMMSWTQDPSISEVHVGVGDDIHEWWREFPASSASGLTRTSIAYVPHIGTFGSNLAPQNVYVAPDGQVAAINVLIVEISGMGPWDTVAATNTGYTAAGTSVSLSASAPAQSSFFIGATGGDNISSGQAFLPSGWQGLVTQTQTNGSNTLADNILTAAFLPSTTGSVSVSGTSSSSEDMSGFLLGVYVSAASPIPANSNPNWPYVVVEAGFGAGFNTPDSEITWTDVSSRPWNWDETTGIQFDLGQLQATNGTIEFDNGDGNLSPLNSASPYYPHAVPGTPVRMRFALGAIGGNTVNRWYVLQRNASQWGEQISGAYRKYCMVSATDMWAALSDTPPTMYRTEVAEDNPYAWWTMDDQPGTSGVQPTQLLNAAAGNTNVLNILLSPNGGAVQQFYTESGTTSGGFIPPGLPTYTTGANQGWMFGDPQSSPSSAAVAAGNPVTATPGSAAWQTTGQAGSTGSFGWYLSCNDTNFPALSGGITAEIWFNYQFYGSGNGLLLSSGPPASFSPVTQQPHSTPLTIFELATNSAPVAVCQLDANGHLNLITYNGATGTSHSIYTASDLRSNSWHMVTLTATATTWQVYLDGGANANVSGTATGMTSAWDWLIVNGDLGSSGGGNPSALVHGGNGSFAHLAVYPYILPYYRVMAHYWAAVTAFGQLPAPTGAQVQFIAQPTVGSISPTTPESLFQVYTPDGSIGGSSSPGPSYLNSNGVSASAVIVATAPGGITSGPSAWVTGTQSGGFTVFDDQIFYTTYGLWIGWTGLAPSFNVYTASDVTVDHEAAVINGSGASFANGYGATARGHGVAQTAGGDGSTPPSAASAIGDTVGQRIERLMNGGKFTSTNRCVDPAPLLVQAPGNQGGGVQAGAAIQAIQASDSGLLFVDNLNHLTYWQRPHLASQYSTPVWNIGPSSGKYPYYKEIEWVTDPQRVWNAITIAPLSPTGAALPELTPTNASGVLAAQEQYGAQPLQITSWLQSQAEMQAQANWLFSTWGTPQRRAQQVKIDAASNPAFWPLVVGVNVGDVVTLEDWAIGGGGTVYTMRVTEIRRHFEYGANSSGGNEVIASCWLTIDFEPSSYFN